MYLILIGGGNVGIQLAKRLIARKDEVLLLEKDSSQARKLANLLGEEHILVGDGCDLNTQREAGFARADAIVAVTGEDGSFELKNLPAGQYTLAVWHETLGEKEVSVTVNEGVTAQDVTF